MESNLQVIKCMLTKWKVDEIEPCTKTKKGEKRVHYICFILMSMTTEKYFCVLG